MEVWICSHGERAEGGRVDGVFGSYDSALAFTQNQMDGEWEKEDIDYFTHGCDFLKIEKHEVK